MIVAGDPIQPPGENEERTDVSLLQFFMKLALSKRGVKVRGAHGFSQRW
jgi:hypothetical protein